MRRLAAVLALTTLTAAAPPPKLLVVISVDQFSADLFAEYRQHYTGGLKRLSEGAVFPSGFQSHAATETCPGHSTILTGDHPARTGIIANSWIDQGAARADKTIYCAEDERVPGSSSSSKLYTPSDVHLRVPTLGDRMKAASPSSRSVSVAGKDRAAIMMGGHNTDQIWFLDPKTLGGFATLGGRAATPAATRASAQYAALLARPAKAMKLPADCARKSGEGRFAREANKPNDLRASPALDAAVIGLAEGLIDEMQLGRDAAADIIAIGLSANDYVGHAYGPGGAEMCIQQYALDAALGRFFKRLDARHLDYAVVLTADHGGHDTPERNRMDALPDAQRVDPELTPANIGKQVAAQLKLDGPILLGAEPVGDIWLDRAVPAGKRAAALNAARALYLKHPQVAAVFTADDIAATPPSTHPPEYWSLAERARASFDPARSGDLVVFLKPRVVPIARPLPGYAATHGSPWDYDRRVPMLFWRKGLVPFEQPNGVETVDIAPTLAALIGLSIPAGDVDGRCLDLIAGPESSCGATSASRTP